MCTVVKPSQAIFKTHPSPNFPVIPLHSALSSHSSPVATADLFSAYFLPYGMAIPRWLR